MKKCILSFLLVFLINTNVSSQVDKFSFSLEYSPNYSTVSSSFSYKPSKLSHGVFTRLQYDTRSRIRPTIGLGYFQTGEYIKTVAEVIYEKEADLRYLVLPVGMQIDFDKFYFLGEIGLGKSLSITNERILSYPNGDVEVQNLRKVDFTSHPGWTFPLMLSIGHAKKIANTEFLFGLKGYYSLNNSLNLKKYLGLGALIGIRI